MVCSACTSMVYLCVDHFSLVSFKKAVLDGLKGGSYDFAQVVSMVGSLLSSLTNLVDLSLLSIFGSDVCSSTFNHNADQPCLCRTLRESAFSSSIQLKPTDTM